MLKALFVYSLIGGEPVRRRKEGGIWSGILIVFFGFCMINSTPIASICS